MDTSKLLNEYIEQIIKSVKLIGESKDNKNVYIHLLDKQKDFMEINTKTVKEEASKIALRGLSNRILKKATDISKDQYNMDNYKELFDCVTKIQKILKNENEDFSDRFNKNLELKTMAIRNVNIGKKYVITKKEQDAHKYILLKLISEADFTTSEGIKKYTSNLINEKSNIMYYKDLIDTALENKYYTMYEDLVKEENIKKEDNKVVSNESVANKSKKKKLVKVRKRSTNRNKEQFEKREEKNKMQKESNTSTSDVLEHSAKKEKCKKKNILITLFDKIIRTNLEKLKNLNNKALSRKQDSKPKEIKSLDNNEKSYENLVNEYLRKVLKYNAVNYFSKYGRVSDSFTECWIAERRQNRAKPNFEDYIGSQICSFVENEDLQFIRNIQREYNRQKNNPLAIKEIKQELEMLEFDRVGDVGTKTLSETEKDIIDMVNIINVKHKNLDLTAVKDAKLVNDFKQYAKEISDIEKGENQKKKCKRAKVKKRKVSSRELVSIDR